MAQASRPSYGPLSWHRRIGGPPVRRWVHAWSARANTARVLHATSMAQASRPRYGPLS